MVWDSMWDIQVLMGGFHKWELRVGHKKVTHQCIVAGKPALIEDREGLVLEAKHFALGFFLFAGKSVG